MDKWVGFSDEELRRLKGQQDNAPRQANPRSARGRPANVRGRASPKDRFIQKKPVDSTSMNKANFPSELPPEARLSNPPPDERSSKSNLSQISNKNLRQKDTPLTEEQSKTTPTSAKQNASDQNQNHTEQSKGNGELEEKDMILDEKDIIKQEMDNVVKFQFQQKLIEEQNKKKRQLLASAIVERQKKAKQEASRLTNIQKELSQLDQLLAIDVSIIRNKIEEASREYLDAQRRYERAEKEYIESKMDLHQKSELKDSLTEHLHLIIHQNEVRKAKKLTELMQKLSMEGGEEVYVEGLDSEELAKTAPSAFILGSLHSTQEQRMVMERSRRSSESDHQVPKKEDSTMKRSTSDQGGKPSEGVTGWISGLIFGSTSPEVSNPNRRDPSPFILGKLHPPEVSDPNQNGNNKSGNETQVIVAAPVSAGSPIKEVSGNGGVPAEAISKTSPVNGTKSLEKSDISKASPDFKVEQRDQNSDGGAFRSKPTEPNLESVSFQKSEATESRTETSIIGGVKAVEVEAVLTRTESVSDSPSTQENVLSSVDNSTNQLKTPSDNHDEIKSNLSS